MSDRLDCANLARRTVAIAVLAALALSVVALTGCAKTPTGVKLTPKVKPPVVKDAGVLRVAVDTELPPFAGKVGSTRAGIDIDVASALAARLGLKVKLVQVKASDVATSLAEGAADIALVGMTVDQVDLTVLSVAGSYGLDAPVFFASQAGTVTIDTLGTKTVGAQKGSAAYWRLTEDLGEDAVRPFNTLSEALGALNTGGVDVVAGDSMVGSYIARDLPGVKIVGQVSNAMPLAVLVSKDAQDLEEVVRTELDNMSGDGTLDAIMRQWVPDMPVLTTSETSTTP